MTFLSDLIRGGYWGLQHHERKNIVGKDWKKDLRLLRFAARVDHVRGRKVLRQPGPVMGGFVWDTKDAKAYPNIWSFAAPSAPNGSGQVSLVKGPKWSETVSGVKPMSPSFNNEQQFPAGWSAVTLAGVDFDKQNELALAGFDGIVAPHFENIPKLGTPVWELSGRGLGARARFQSLARLYEPPTPTKCLAWGDGNHLALQLGSSTDGAGYLVMADDPDKLTTGGLQDLGTGNKRGGGPFDVGGGACPHVHGKNARGETMRALHFTTSALFRGGVGDGPLYFKNKVYDQNVFDAPFKNKVEILWNPERLHVWGCGVANGIWEAQSESFASLIIPPKKPIEPKDEPPEGDNGGFDPVSGFPAGPVDDGKLPPELITPPGLFGGPARGDGRKPPIDDDSDDGEFPRELFIPPELFDGQPVGEFPEGPVFTDPLPRELFTPPELFGGERITDLRNTPRPIYGTSLELAFPAIVGRAQHFSKKKHDLRSLGKRLNTEQLEFWACLPATMRSEYFGAQTEDCFSETQNKRDGRYQNVPTANGGRVNMPPELGLEYLVDGYDDLTGLDYSTATEVYWKTRLAFGTPDLETGGYKLGFHLEQSAAGQKLKLQHTALSGTESNNYIEFDANGGLAADGTITAECVAPTGFKIPSVIVTSSTTLTIPYGTVWLNHAAAITITLPENPDFSELVFKDVSSAGAGTNNVTIQGAFSDTIDGASSYALNTNGGSVTLRASEDLANIFIVSERLT